MHALTNLLTASAVLLAVAKAADTVVNPALNAQLTGSSTQLQRLALLPDDSSWKFDFTKHEYYTFSPGGVVNANAASFPATIGNDMTMAMLNLGPCSILPPHYHPRAANYVVAVLGNTTTYMIEENGANIITETLLPGQMTIFPRASLHSMQNTGCTNAQLVSALNSNDQGTHNVLNGLFTLPTHMVAAAFGNNAAADLAKLKAGVPDVGTGSVVGDEECRRRCGLM